MRPIRVVHVITRLIVGGAQENTVLSCALIDRVRFPSDIVVGPQTGPEGELFTEARARGLDVHLEPTLVREVSPAKDALSGCCACADPPAVNVCDRNTTPARHARARSMRLLNNVRL